MSKVVTNKRLLPNYWYAILSVALVLVLLGFFGMLLIQSKVIFKTLKEQINIIVELKENATDDDVAHLRSQLQERAFVKPKTIQYVSKEQALDLLREEYGDDFMKLDMQNPLYNSLTFNIKSEYMDAEVLADIRLKILDNTNVRDVYYQQNVLDAIASNLSKIAWIGLTIGLFFMLVAVFLIHNTMRLALYAQRILIKNMELVGASWSFISRPFLRRSIINGLWSALLASVVLVVLFSWIHRQIPQLLLDVGRPQLVLLGIGLAVLGVLISTLSTYFVVHKYLGMRLDDLY